MDDQQLLVGSHPPFCHNGSSVAGKNYHIMLAALPASLMGIYHYGIPAIGVLALSVSSAMVWDLLMDLLMGRSPGIGDGHAALIGLLFGMLVPATMPWWAVSTGTFLAVVIGKQIFGGRGCNPFHPALLAMAMIIISWEALVDFNEALLDYDLGFYMAYPLSTLKAFGPAKLFHYNAVDLLLGRQSGGIGATFGLGLIVGGLYLILRGHIRWEIPFSFLFGVWLTALLFHASAPEQYGGALFHLLTGYTLIGAFFLATDDASSPVNFFPMLLYGAGAGVLTVLIRNLGAFVDGTVFAILMMNVANPILDHIRPKPLGAER